MCQYCMSQCTCALVWYIYVHTVYARAYVSFVCVCVEEDGVFTLFHIPQQQCSGNRKQRKQHEKGTPHAERKVAKESLQEDGCVCACVCWGVVLNIQKE